MAHKPRLLNLLLSIGASENELNLFSPVNLSYVNLIVWPAKEPRREERKNCPPLWWVLIIVVKETKVAAA